MKSLTVKFEVRSLDPDRPIIEAVPQIEALSSELQANLATQFPGATVEIRRAQGIPGLPQLQEILLHIDWHATAHGAEEAAGAFLATQFLKLIKTKVRNVFAKQVSEVTGPSVAQTSPKIERKRRGRASKKQTTKGKKTGSTQKSKSHSSPRKRKR